MGCCSSQRHSIFLGRKNNLYQADLDIKCMTYCDGFPSRINDPIAVLENISLNPLGYAL